MNTKEEISKLVADYKNGKSDAINKILVKMSPLIKKYAHKLYDLEFEDMCQEMNLAVFSAIKKMDKYDNDYECISYIVYAVKNRYHELCRYSMKIKSIEVLMENETINTAASENTNPYEDIEFLLDINKTMKSISEPKQKIIIMILNLGLSDKEIAGILGKSRQYINRLKKRIFEEIKI